MREVLDSNTFDHRARLIDDMVTAVILKQRKSGTFFDGDNKG